MPTSRLFALGHGAAVLALLPASAFAQFTVNTTADTPDANPGDGICADAAGNCSLRAAIQESNALGGGVVLLAPGAVYSLTLTGAGEDGAATGDLDVTGRLVLRGNGATIDGLGADRIFDVASGASLLVAGLTVTGGGVVGESGGAFRNRGSLAVQRSSITNSVASGAGASGGGIFNEGGTLRVLDSSIEGCSAERAGGAIEANAGDAELTGTLVQANAAGPNPGNGGGLHLTGAGQVRVLDSSFFGNTAEAEGGGLWNSSDGNMTVDDTEVRSNEARGSAADQGGGGLFNDGGSLTVRRTLVRDNLAVTGSGSGGGLLNDGGQVSVELSILRANRSNRAGGGVEAKGGTTTLFNCELSQNETGASPGNGGGLHLTGEGQVTVELTDVIGNRAGAEGGGLWNSSTGTMTVRHSVVMNNSASGDASDQGGGGLFNDGGELRVENCTVSGNAADGAAGSGGGLLNFGGLVTVVGTRMEGNEAQRAGGGIEANGGTTDVDGGVLWMNRCGPAPGNGGALHLTGAGTVDVTGTAVQANEAAAEGGGLWNSAVGTMTVTDCDVSGNRASGDGADRGGGGLFNDGGLLTVSGGTLSGNEADGAAGSGGGVLNDGGELVLSGVTIAGNRSQRAGGGVEAKLGTTSLERVRLHGNQTGPAPGNGGGLHLTGAGFVDVLDSSVTENVASNEGGGLWNSSTGVMTVTSSRIGANLSLVGDNLFNDGGSFTVDGADVPLGG
ncbi:CSLREA domain-containing protein [Engelhardtia mirabilis]|uniref:Right handed beta helix domain-containing protein n=1 Tax=Engelhardtia mirabilis TaxID=2528011 RepID=A0A518BFY3_9BACT|nr:hypothetical protein Pla133_09420 [Planctomycetes bacterium Pla133]QDV00202.1 hypothetical protein Pla86_09410 [Planctomycetes bacterium Pla86]